MTQASLAYWSAMCGADVAVWVERAADTLVNATHKWIDPIITGLSDTAASTDSVDLETADEFLSQINDALNKINSAGLELHQLNYDHKPQVETVISRVQYTALSGVFDAMQLLKQVCCDDPQEVFSSEGMKLVAEALERAGDCTDIAAGEHVPLRVQKADGLIP